MNQLLQVLLECISILKNSSTFFTITLIAAIILSIIGYYITIHYGTWWNRKYGLKWWQHALCIIASAFTFFFVMSFGALKFIEDVADRAVTIWKQSAVKDQSWFNGAFIQAYEDIKDLEIEDFTGFPHPEEGGQRIPITNDETKERVALIYSKYATKHFKSKNSFWSSVLSLNAKEAKTEIQQDIKNYFKNTLNRTYQVQDAINVAGNDILARLRSQLKGVVFRSRLILIFLFIIVQLIPFSIIGWLAYRDIRT